MFKIWFIYGRKVEQPICSLLEFCRKVFSFFVTEIIHYAESLNLQYLIEMAKGKENQIGTIYHKSTLSVKFPVPSSP